MFSVPEVLAHRLITTVGGPYWKILSCIYICVSLSPFHCMMSWLHQQFQYNAQMVHSVIKWMIIYHTFNDNAFFFFQKEKPSLLQTHAG